MANYLYLPVFVVCLFAFLITLLETIVDGAEFWRRENTFAIGLTGLGVVSFALWRFARRPRPRLLLLQGILLASLTTLWVGWFLYAMLFGKMNVGWGLLGVVGVVGSLLWLLLVATGMGGAAATSVKYWRQLSRIHPKDLQQAVERTQTQTPEFLEILSHAPVHSISFAAGSIFLLPPEQIEPAPAEEIEAGLWKDEWVVIAVEQPDGKPIYIDTTAEDYPVFLARREPESWHHTRIADSLRGFLDALNKLAQGSEGVQVGMRNPLLEDETGERILSGIARDNPQAEMWFWKRLLIPPEP